MSVIKISEKALAYKKRRLINSLKRKVPEGEKRRLTDLFKRVKKKIGDSRCDEVELEIIKLEETAENWGMPLMTGGIERELLPHRKVMVLNAARTSEMSDMGVVGTIAHEFAHLFDESLQNLSHMTREEVDRVFKESEERADKLAIKWGFKDELKVSTAEVVSLNKAGLTLEECNKLVDSWKPPRLHAPQSRRRRKGPKRRR